MTDEHRTGKPTDRHREITQLRCSRADVSDAERRGYNPRTNQLGCALYPAFLCCYTYICI